MARIRTIKPEFWTDEKVIELSPYARLLFIGMWNFVDDEGRAEYSPTRLKLQILPSDDVNIEELCAELTRLELVSIYSHNSKDYMEVTNFSKHQRIDKRRKSKHPAQFCADLRNFAPTCGNLQRTAEICNDGREREREKETPYSPPCDRNGGTSDKKPKSKRKTKVKIPPDKSEFIDYCKKNGFGHIAEKAWNYYCAGDWHDTQGRPVKSWKQKLQGVWFNSEKNPPPEQERDTYESTPESIEYLQEICRKRGEK